MRNGGQIYLRFLGAFIVSGTITIYILKTSKKKKKLISHDIRQQLAPEGLLNLRKWTHGNENQ